MKRLVLHQDYVPAPVVEALDRPAVRKTLDEIANHYGLKRIEVTIIDYRDGKKHFPVSTTSVSATVTKEAANALADDELTAHIVGAWFKSLKEEKSQKFRNNTMLVIVGTIAAIAGMNEIEKHYNDGEGLSRREMLRLGALGTIGNAASYLARSRHMRKVDVPIDLDAYVGGLIKLDKMGLPVDFSPAKDF